MIHIIKCLGKLFTSVINERLTVLFTSIINERLTHFSNKNNVAQEKQAGLGQGYSPLGLIFLLKSTVDIFLWKMKRLFCRIDYGKTFGTIWRDGPWYNMVKANIGGKVFSVVKNKHMNIKSCGNLNQQKN